MARTTRVLLALFVFTLPFDQAFALPFVGSLNRALGLVVALAGLLTLMSGSSIRLRKLNLFVISASIFVICNILSTVWAIDRASAISQSFTYIQLWVMIWLLWQFVETSAQACRLRQAYMLGTWVTIGTIIWGYMSDNPTIDAMRFTAFDTNANYTALSIGLAIPMAFDAAANDRGWSRLLAILLIPASVFGIALTGSRGGALIAGFALVASIMLIIRGKVKMKALVMLTLAGLIGGLAALLPAEATQRFTGTLTEVESGDFSGRGVIWEAGFEAWLYRPAMGAGAGNFSQAIAPTLGRSLAAHNSFLNLLVELGPIGPTLFLMLFLVAIWPHLLVLVRRDGSLTGEARRYAALHVVLLVALLLAQLPANWQYQRVTWYLLVAATLNSALFLRAAKPAGVIAHGHAG